MDTLTIPKAGDTWLLKSDPKKAVRVVSADENWVHLSGEQFKKRHAWKSTGTFNKQYRRARFVKIEPPK